MKLSNILSALFFLFISASCSMESQRLMDDIEKETSTNSEMYVAFNIALATNGGVQTKATTVRLVDGEAPNDSEKSVINCFIAVFENDTKKFLGSRLYTEPQISGDNEYLLDGKVIVKLPATKTPDLLFVAVAQMNSDIYEEQSSIHNGILNCVTYDDLMDFVLQENPTVLVKVGERTLTSSDYEKYVTISSNVNNVEHTRAPFTIEVKQRSAAVELVQFKVQDADEQDQIFSINSVQLLNVALTTKVGGADEPVEFANSESIGDALNHRFYTYQNNTDTRAALRITYTVGGVTESKDITIKSPVADSWEEKVLANHLYKLDVTIMNTTVRVRIECYTKDWVEGGEIDIVL